MSKALRPCGDFKKKRRQVVVLVVETGEGEWERGKEEAASIMKSPVQDMDTKKGRKRRNEGHLSAEGYRCWPPPISNITPLLFPHEQQMRFPRLIHEVSFLRTQSSERCLHFQVVDHQPRTCSSLGKCEGRSGVQFVYFCSINVQMKPANQLRRLCTWW